MPSLPDLPCVVLSNVTFDTNGSRDLRRDELVILLSCELDDSGKQFVWRMLSCDRSKLLVIDLPSHYDRRQMLSRWTRPA